MYLFKKRSQIKGPPSQMKMMNDLEDLALVIWESWTLINSAHYEASLSLHKAPFDFSGTQAQSGLREVMVLNCASYPTKQPANESPKHGQLNYKPPHKIKHAVWVPHWHQ